MKFSIVFFLFTTFSILSQESLENYVEPVPETKPKEVSSKNPHIAALLGIVPGVGQAYIGNHYTAAGQGLTFLGLYNMERNFRRQPDYIRFTDREVKFDLNDAIVGYEFQKMVGYTTICLLKLP